MKVVVVELPRVAGCTRSTEQGALYVGGKAYGLDSCLVDSAIATLGNIPCNSKPALKGQVAKIDLVE